MTFLQDLIQRSKGFLGSRRPEPERHTDAIRHTRFDAMIFEELLEDAPALADMANRLNEEWDYTFDMVRDVLMEFWQGAPQMRTAAEMRPGWLTNLAVTDHIVGCPDTEQTRSYTIHDKYAAALATLAVSDEIERFLNERREQQEQAQDAASAAERAAADAAGAAEGLAQALQAAEEAGWPEIGPPSPTQQEAAGALAQALAQAQVADEHAEQAEQEAHATHEQATQGLRTAVQQGVQEAHKQLDEEAALMAAWGQEPGDLKRMSFEERAKLAQRLRSNRLNDYVDLVGRFRMRATAERVRKVEYGRDEVVGAELSGDLTRLVPSEMVALAVPELELDFMIRLAEQRLLSRRLRGSEKVGKGAIIMAIDCSDSMTLKDVNGISREAWAKAFALALLDQAARSKRDFVAILFSSRRQQHMIDFPKGHAPLDKVMELAEHFYSGGTDFMAPMDVAMRRLAADFDTDGRMKADIVFVTDGECGVTPDWMARYQAAKHKLGFRTFGIQVGPGQRYETLAAMSDNVRQVEEFASPSVVADVFRVIE